LVTKTCCSIVDQLIFPQSQPPGSISNDDITLREIGIKAVPHVPNLLPLSRQYIPIIENRLFLPAIEQTSEKEIIPQPDFNGELVEVTLISVTIS
jgi:hypothetical protein